MRRGGTSIGAPAVVLAAALTAAPAPARAGCVESDFTGDTPRAATVRGGAPRVHFIHDAALAPGCPNATAACRARAFVVPGDTVLLAQARGDVICAAFTNARGTGTVGWLPSAAVAPMPEETPGLGDWIGHWTVFENDIVVTRAKAGGLSFKGAATWGAGDPERVRRGGVHTGEFSAEAHPVGGGVAFTAGEDRTRPYEAGDETECRVRMARRGPYLVVRDNNGCGGLNVSFSGIYRRRP